MRLFQHCQKLLKRNRRHFYFEIGTIKIEKKLFQIKNLKIHIIYIISELPIHYIIPQIALTWKADELFHGVTEFTNGERQVAVYWVHG